MPACCFGDNILFDYFFILHFSLNRCDHCRHESWQSLCPQPLLLHNIISILHVWCRLRWHLHFQSVCLNGCKSQAPAMCSYGWMLRRKTTSLSPYYLGCQFTMWQICTLMLLQSKTERFRWTPRGSVFVCFFTSCFILLCVPTFG